MKTKKITATMQAVIDHMKATGKPLRRWRGGWWGTIGSPLRKFDSLDVPVPDWGTQTVRALFERGIIRRTEKFDHWHQDDFVLVLTDVEKRALGLVKHGADVYDYGIAKTLRALEKRGLVTITKAMMPPSGENVQPYFGAKAKVDLFGLDKVAK